MEQGQIIYNVYYDTYHTSDSLWKNCILRCIFYSDVKKIKVDETRILSVIASLTSKCELDGHFSEIKGPIKPHWFCQH